MRADLINDTDEEIVIPPGESVRIHYEEDKRKSTVTRSKRIMVNRTGTDPMDAVTFVECEDCGERVPADVLDVGGHEC